MMQETKASAVALNNDANLAADAIILSVGYQPNSTPGSER